MKKLKNLKKDRMKKFIDLAFIGLMGFAGAKVGANVSSPMEMLPAMETENYVHNHRGNDDSSLRYLKLAHAITTKNLNYEKDVSDCTEYSNSTYSNYLSLIEKSNRMDLVDKVRLAIGPINYEGSRGYHAWLEIVQGDSWVPYETTRMDLEEDIEILPQQIDNLIPTNIVLGPRDVEYIRIASRRFDENYDLDFLNIIRNLDFLLEF